MSRPAVLFGGPSPEHDISILSGLPAAAALRGAGVDVACIYWSKAGEFYAVDPGLEAAAFIEGPPRGATRLELLARPGGGFVGEPGRLGRRATFDVGVIVNCCHGGPGEDGTLQAALDLAGIRYTGPSAAGAALGMDKFAFGAVVTAAGLPSLPRAVVSPATEALPFDGPYIVKPRFGGSSIGIEVTDDVATIRALVQSSPFLRDGAVAEPFLPGAVDLNVSVRAFPALQVSAVERPLRGQGAIYGYADKYLGGEGLVSAPRELPAQLPPAVQGRIQSAASTLATVAMVRGVARIDFLWHGDDLYVNEINTIPGSLARYFWSIEDVPFATLLRDMIAEAQQRPPRRMTADGADGTALRAAGSVASKLA